MMLRGVSLRISYGGYYPGRSISFNNTTTSLIMLAIHVYKQLRTSLILFLALDLDEHMVSSLLFSIHS